jgi:hypothetical protein
VEELNDFLEIVKSFLPILGQKSPLLLLDPEAEDLADPALSQSVRLVSLALLLPALLLPRRWHATALGPVGERQQVIEDVHFTLRSTAEGRTAAPEMVTMTTMAVFQRQTLWE